MLKKILLFGCISALGLWWRSATIGVHDAYDRSWLQWGMILGTWAAWGIGEFVCRPLKPSEPDQTTRRQLAKLLSTPQKAAKKAIVSIATANVEGFHR